VAVRRPSGQIVVRERLFRSIAERFPLFKLPFLRGIVVLIETLSGGMDALSFSAEQADDREANAAGPDKPSRLATALTLGVALLFGVGLFVVLPHGLTWFVGRYFGGLALQSVGFHLVAGALKLAIFVGYLGVLSLMPDIRRVFMYHGAEHKVIATHEAGEPLDVEHARRHTTFHARCGTSFLLVVVVSAIVLFAVVFPLIPGLGDGVGSHALAIAIKIPLLLPIAGLAYEANRLAANHLDNPLVRLFVSPGFLMQRLTTSEPTDEMLEVALSSLKAALRRHQVGAEDEDPVAVYRDFAEICARVV
jgi:uncharacterized protein YqhQ